jgi:hypothetical protein
MPICLGLRITTCSITRGHHFTNFLVELQTISWFSNVPFRSNKRKIVWTRLTIINNLQKSSRILWRLTPSQMLVPDRTTSRMTSININKSSQLLPIGKRKLRRALILAQAREMLLGKQIALVLAPDTMGSKPMLR